LGRIEGMKKIIKIKEIILSIIILIWGFKTIAQSAYADTLQSMLSAHPQNDTIKVNLLNELAWEFRRNNVRQSDSLTDLSLNLATRLNYAKGNGIAFVIKGAHYTMVSDYSSARKAFEKGQKFLETVGDKAGLALLLRSQARLDIDEGNYSESLYKLMQGLSLARDVHDVKSIVSIEAFIGYLYGTLLGEYEKAIPFQNDALRQAENTGYKAGMATAYNPIAEMFKTRGNYSASLDAYMKGLLIDEELKDSLEIVIALSNIADVYERMGDYKQAFFYINRVGNYFISKNHPRLQVWVEWVLGKAYLHTGNADSGFYYGKHSLMLARKLGYREMLIEIAQLIAESAAKLKMYDTAYKYQQLSSAYKDTLAGQHTARKTTMLQAQIELDKKQSQIAFLTKDKQLKMAEGKRQRLFLYAVLSGLAFVVVLAVILFRNNRLKQRANLLLQKQKKEIETQKQKVEYTLEELKSTQMQLIELEKEKMLTHHHKELLKLEAKALRAQMNPHFIYNCMNSIKALIQNDDKLRSIEYLTTFSKLIRTIFQNSDKRQISLYDEIETCKLYTQLESMRLNGKLEYSFCVDPNLDLKSLMVPALIIQPFIENAIWHGIVPNDGGIINISVKGNEEVIFCEVDDNGIGREMSKLNKPITPVTHESKGVHLSQQRLNLEKMLNDTNTSIEIIDKYDNNIATGTRVKLSFNLN